MASRKITLILDTDLLENVDIIAEAKDQSRTQLIADLLTGYVAENIDKAKAIKAKQAELEQLKKGL